jgi:beta-glucosidase
VLNSTILLKNENSILPILLSSGKQKIGLIGSEQDSETFIAAAEYLKYSNESIFGENDFIFEYSDASDFSSSLDIALRNDILIVLLRRSENSDSYLFSLSIINRLLKTNNEIIVVIDADYYQVNMNIQPEALDLKWTDRVPVAILGSYMEKAFIPLLPTIIFGTSNPSGKLPITFPIDIKNKDNFSKMHNSLGGYRYVNKNFVNK